MSPVITQLWCVPERMTFEQFFQRHRGFYLTQFWHVFFSLIYLKIDFDYCNCKHINYTVKSEKLILLTQYTHFGKQTMDILRAGKQKVNTPYFQIYDHLWISIYCVQD